LEQRQYFARKKATWLRPACSRHKGRIDAIPYHFQHLLGGILNAYFDTVGDGHDGRLPLPPHLYTRSGCMPAADADLDEILGRHVGNIRRVKPGRSVPALVEIRLLRLHMPVKMEDVELPAVQIITDFGPGGVAHAQHLNRLTNAFFSG
jgi:hypothetical protein